LELRVLRGCGILCFKIIQLSLNKMTELQAHISESRREKDNGLRIKSNGRIEATRLFKSENVSEFIPFIPRELNKIGIKFYLSKKGILMLEGQ